MDSMLQQSRWEVHLRPVRGSIPQGPIDYSGRRGRRMWRICSSLSLLLKDNEEIGEGSVLFTFIILDPTHNECRRCFE